MTSSQDQSDHDLKAAVVSELRWMPSVNSTNVGVAVRDGAVTLSGEVGSYPEKLLAGKAALRVHGVTAIAQEITVRSPVGAANDIDIARGARAALQLAVDVPDSVKASVSDHGVTLSGVVTWQYEREAADRAVRYLRGVTNVRSTISIRPSVIEGDIEDDIAAPGGHDATNPLQLGY